MNKRQAKEASKAQLKAPQPSAYSLRMRRPDTKPAVVISNDNDQNKENKIRVTLQKTEPDQLPLGGRNRSSRSHKALRSKSNNSAAAEKATITANVNVTSHE